MSKRIMLFALLSLAPVTFAQTLAEVTLVAAVSSELSPAVSLPSGSYRAVGSGTAPFIAKVPGNAQYKNWEVYTASGVVAKLQPAFVGQLTTSFAAAGYFLSDQSEAVVAGETRTRYLFSGDAGATLLLYTIRTPEDLVWLVAEER
ncbi:hypothetical protein BH24DEI2_BH24DEI2_21370 [soil metagenome]